MVLDTSRLPSYRPSHFRRYHPYAWHVPRGPRRTWNEGDAARMSGTMADENLGTGTLETMDEDLSNLSIALYAHPLRTSQLSPTELIVDLAFAVQAVRHYQNGLRAHADSTDVQ
ncbi:hypothetical protein OBBRIDRAFT_832688 [Obba rivulosa]|uniref:Uncharacterized protein n=1 Tax=Obba rivulosa TaxID=1052685 RepID=A0A8E2J2T8_9APHY|nr:hypothetical protein OBBRIDRAFT_832688 [Obba rivulosa]